MLHCWFEKSSILLGSGVAPVLPRWSVKALAWDEKLLSSLYTHSLGCGLIGYQILFAPHTFVS